MLVYKFNMDSRQGLEKGLNSITHVHTGTKPANIMEYHNPEQPSTVTNNASFDNFECKFITYLDRK